AHPLYTVEFAQKYGGVIEDAYRQMDGLLGLVLNHVDDQTVLLVISDHGFKSFRRAVHLNSWLRDNGFLIYKEATAQKAGDEFFKDVDWSRSKAYAVGLGSVYLNQKGREKEGIVEPGAEADAVKREIARKLKELKDAKTGRGAVRAVHLGEEIFSGDAIAEAPDLLVGFEDGYRASWQTALGAAPADQIEDNLKKWSGDHIIDSTLVPGVFFSNRKVDVGNPSLYDMSPTVLSLFGIEVPADQPGRNLLQMREAAR
ncbi:MAG: alkaline phosphatase family protein, partial [Candidatus Omnitrophota bacterium]